ncbi:MAG: hypothetical protein R2728_08250 [Chitinophagales bacterium]
MNRSIKFPLINSIALVFMLTMNYLSNTSILSENNIGDISDKYNTLITPAGYAFSIWGIIFLGLIGFVGFQWYQYATNNEQPEYETAGFYFAISSVLNGLWTFIFLKEWVWLSLLIMLGLLYCLVKLIIVYRNDTYNAPVKKVVFQWWPISLYLGWIILATVLNVATFLVSIGFEGGPFSETTWAIIILFTAGLIYSYLMRSRNISVASLAGLWGLYGIVVAQKGNNDTVVSAVWLVFGIVSVVTLLHWIKNWNSNFISKLSRGEW